MKGIILLMMLSIDNAVLCVVDVQGKLARVVAESEVRIQRIGILANAAGLLGIPTLLTVQVPQKIGSTIPEIRTILTAEPEIPRISFSILAEPAVQTWFAEHTRRQVLLCGFETHICIYQSALALREAGYEVSVIVDAVSSRSMEDKDAALSELARHGVSLITTEMALFAVLRDASHPAFKAVSALVK